MANLGHVYCRMGCSMYSLFRCVDIDTVRSRRGVCVVETIGSWAKLKRY